MYIYCCPNMSPWLRTWVWRSLCSQLASYFRSLPPKLKGNGEPSRGIDSAKSILTCFVHCWSKRSFKQIPRGGGEGGGQTEATSQTHSWTTFRKTMKAIVVLTCPHGSTHEFDGVFAVSLQAIFAHYLQNSKVTESLLEASTQQSLFWLALSIVDQKDLSNKFHSHFGPHGWAG